MKFKAHIKGAIALGIVANCFLDYGLIDTGFYFGGTIAGGLIPDIDHTKSFLGTRVRLISKPINKRFGHRTLTHSLIVLTSFLFLCDHLESITPFFTGLIIGILSHILLDCFTPGGVALLYPITRRKFRIGFKPAKKSRYRRRRKFS